MTGAKDLVWVPYTGYLLCETINGVGLAPACPSDAVDVWIPKSQLRAVEYKKHGKSDVIHEREPIEAIYVPRWLAEDRNLPV